MQKGLTYKIMDELLKKEFELHNIDIDSALSRFMGNKSLLLKYIKKFVEDTNFDQMLKALEASDSETAFYHAHTLKGICANLSMTSLYDCFSQLTELLRSKKTNEALLLCQDIIPVYKNIKTFIQSL